MRREVRYPEASDPEINQMRAIEITGVVDEQGNLSLNEPMPTVTPGEVRIIILYSDQLPVTESDPDDTPVEEIKSSLRRALQQAVSGQRIPLAQMWDGIETE